MFYEMGDEAKLGEGGPDTKEAEALAAALNHSAERVQTLWFSFLTFMLYLAIATGTTTHRMLFLESPLNLPVLNISLPLLGFYILTPLIFIVFHFYMLLNLVLLARTARTFEDALVRAFPDDNEARENFRMRIENTLFVQLLVGGRLEREGINARLLSAMALISLALAPVALMLMFEIKFLPYHSEWITWLHRGLLALDLALVWTLWPAYRNSWGVRLWPKRSSWRALLPLRTQAQVVRFVAAEGVIAAVALTAVFQPSWLLFGWVGPNLFLAFFFAFFLLWRDFELEDVPVSLSVLLSAVALIYGVDVASVPDESAYSTTDLLYAIEPVNTLNLHGEDLIDDTKLKQIVEKNESSTDVHRWVASLPLAGRDLTGADFSDADIRHVDFSSAILIRANFSGAWAKNAHFDRAQLQGATLYRAELRGASLDHTQLQGAFLEEAQLQGASLDGAQLQGAWLNSAKFQGASLKQAHLQGAALDQADLQGASLDGVQLQGASLNNAYLQGASLDAAQLQGASLNNAYFQGAALKQAQLQGALCTDVCAWRADAQKAIWKDTRVVSPKAGAKDESREEGPHCDWTGASFGELKQLIAKQVPEGKLRDDALARIENRLDPTKALEGDDEMARVWGALASSSPTQEVYEKSLAEQWGTTGCAAEGAPYVLRALLGRLDGDESPFAKDSPEVPKLAAAFLAKDCAGARGLSEDEIAKLKAIRDRAPPPAPKP